MLAIFRRALLAPICAAIVAAVAMPVLADEYEDAAPRALSPADRLSYTNAFDALRRGDLNAARDAARAAHDRVLLGQVEFERLFHRDYTATYEELTTWLDEYHDLPCAQRAYDLALRRRPDGAPEPRRPSSFSVRTWQAVANAGRNVEGDPLRAARVAYNNDDLVGAVNTGQQIGDWWTVGLATWRLNDFPYSAMAFERVLDDPTQDPWVRAGAAVWAARAAHRSGRIDRVQPLLRRASQWPATFYGQIALAQLGEAPTIENASGPGADGARPYQATGLVRVSNDIMDRNAPTAAELDAFIRSDERARRTVAYSEVGRRADAVDELRAGLRGAFDDGARRLWTGLARALGSRVTGNQRDAEQIDAGRYPMPAIQPEGGFTTERALVYAIARKESNFNARARSGAGAYGLMQVMPSTAAEMSGDRGFVQRPERLFDPAVNARYGQGYINRVLAMPAIDGDLLRAAASYNAGPGPTMAAVRRLGPDADPLLLIETIDVPQARDYVEKVVAAYWIYQRMMGRPLNTLNAVASGATRIPLSLDYVPEPQPLPMTPVQPASVEPVPAQPAPVTTASLNSTR